MADFELNVDNLIQRLLEGNLFYFLKYIRCTQIKIQKMHFNIEIDV